MKTAESVYTTLKEAGYNASIINGRFIKPIDKDAVKEAAKNHKWIVTMEENVVSGGFGEKVLHCIHDEHLDVEYISFTIPDAYVEHGNVELLKKEIGLDADSIAAKIIEEVKNRS